VPEKLHDLVADRLSCPNCGAELDTTTDVGVRETWEIRRDDFVDRAKADYIDKIHGLKAELESHFSLGLTGELGNLLLEEVQRIAKTDGPNCTQITGEYYRARRISNSDVPKKEDMWAAPTGKSDEGRYNHAGQSVLYLASEEYVAAREVLGDVGRSVIVWMQKYTLNEVAPVLDLAVDWDEIGIENSPLLTAVHVSGVIRESVDDKENRWKPQYFLTRFIADCARFAGMKGVLYDSACTFGKNLVLFNPGDCAIGPACEPYIFRYDPPIDSLCMGFHGLLDDPFD
jgi:RES domain-containing protein